MRSLLILATLLLCLACSTPSPSQLTERERTLGHDVGLQDSITRIIRAESLGELQPLVPLDSMGNPLPARGVAFGLKESQVARTLDRLHKHLGSGYLVFRADQGFGYHPDSIGVVRSGDRLDMLRVRSTNGTNYDIDTDSIVSRVRGWTDTLGFVLTAAGWDWLEGEFPRPPKWKALAEELYAFCPDIVEQGTNTVEALEAEMRKSGKLYCWWD